MTLHADIRSHFSPGEAILTPKEIAEGLKETGWRVAALCDTMTISGLPEFTRELSRVGVRPIIGCRLRIVPSLAHDKKQPTVYPKLFVRNEDGLERLQRLLSLANDEDHFYYVPRLTWRDVLDSLSENAFAFSTGALYSATRDASHISALESVKRALGASLTFSEATPVDTPLWDRQSWSSVSIAADLGLPVLVTRPTLYTPGGDDALQVLGAIAANRKMLSEDLRAYVRDYDWKTPQEVLQGVRDQVARIRCDIDPAFDAAPFARALDSWSELADAAGYVWSKRPITMPKMAPDENAALRDLAKKGFADRVRNPTFGKAIEPSDLPRYVARLGEELDVLTRMGFSGYFLLVADIVKWSKDNGIMVGPGRGSVGGSLVAYALGITDVDPIRFELIFERFINPERLDLPDADLDFMSTRRNEVIEYIERKHGVDRVAGISNYNTLSSASALRESARIMGLSLQEQNISKQVPEEHGQPVELTQAITQSAAIKAFADRHPDVWRRALAIENRIRSFARHAAGVVVAGEPVVNRAVVERRSSERVVNWDKGVVEDMGLVKIDILGLSTLDLMHHALRYIRERHGRTIDLNTLALDDDKVLEAFGQGKTVGVFQFESPGMRRLLRDLRIGGPLTFDDLSAATALYRPGPMDSGLLEDFVQIRKGYVEPYYEHPTMQPALEETYSVIVYQEQVMRIARDLCGFTLAESDHLRKAIGKKDMAKMKALGDKFIDGAIATGLEPAKAKELWEKIVAFAGYAFNKSHSVEYSLISYQSMWLKVHYPVEFFAAALTVLGDEKRQSLIPDARKWGVRVGPPDVNISGSRFEILNDKTLAAPLSIIKGLSEKGTEVIVKERELRGPFASVEDFESRVPARSCNSAVRRKLDEIGSFARIQPGAKPADDPSRRRALIEHCPSIAIEGAVIDREIPRDDVTVREIAGLFKRLREDDAEALAGSVRCLPRFGKSAKFMAILDGPGWSEDEAGQFARGKGFDFVATALAAAGLTVEDGYWTGLSKTAKRKGEKFFDAGQVAAAAPYLEREIEVLRPPAILLLGSNALRRFAPDLKGGNLDHVGKILFNPSLDANILVGFNPAMIAFDGDKQRLLNEVFERLAEILGE